MSATFDQIARERIRDDLETNLLVEAGAGSGKTTALVGRLLQHVRIGTLVDSLTAVTFTRKAADELRERFQLLLEATAHDRNESPEVRARCVVALRDLDHAFLGTIHAFCARLLRERPLEVGLDPAFTEVAETDTTALNALFWRQWIERERRLGSSTLEAVHAIGIETADLFDGFQALTLYPDVDFPSAEVPVPDCGACRQELTQLIARAVAIMPATTPSDGHDKLMLLVQRLQFALRLATWNDDTAFCRILGTIRSTHLKPTQKRWGDTKESKLAAKQLGEAFQSLFDESITQIVTQFREYAYHHVIHVLKRVATEFARTRVARGEIGFDDLLQLAAQLLRENPDVRDELGERYRYLLVDEFQDTDPVQAEICLLLTSPSSEGAAWQRVVPRCGALFVVGDPKQSIYRFRRADIQIYNLVKERFGEFGSVVALTRNFRSVPAIAALVNNHFAQSLPPLATIFQAQFTAMQPEPSDAGHAGVFRYTLSPSESGRDDVVEHDARLLASWIAERVDRGEKKAGDFLILTSRKHSIAPYARALADRNIPARTTGAALLQECELLEMLVILRALADPEHPIAIVAALEGLCFGVRPDALFEARRAGVVFSIATAPALLENDVTRALSTLHDWWLRSQCLSVDVLLEQIVAETGVLFYAASAPLGESRAGALLFLIDALRHAPESQTARVSDAVELIEGWLAAESDDAPLRPGREDAVRIMNLHKAKGLEADTVILAAPVDEKSRPPEVHIQRGRDGRAVGGIVIATGEGNSRRVLAQPVDWDAMLLDERQFAAAETERLLYVATTRAKRELVVAQFEATNAKGNAKPDRSRWRPLADTLITVGASELTLVSSTPSQRSTAGTTADEILREIGVANWRVRDAQVSSTRALRVTRDDATRDEHVSNNHHASGGRGKVWGICVHRCIDALARGRTGARLDAFVQAVARDQNLDETLTTELHRVMTEFAASSTWRSLAAADALLSEVSIARVEVSQGVTTVTDGTADAVVLTDTGWRVIDWKSDYVDADVWALREEGYHAQVAQYAAMLTAVSGHAATASIERVGHAGT